MITFPVFERGAYIKKRQFGNRFVYQRIIWFITEYNWTDPGWC